MRTSLALVGLALTLASTTVRAADAPPTPCRLPGVEHDARCGSVSRLLDPTRPDGPRIDVHYVVLPALARNKKPDPVFFFAGGPGQSAIALAGPLSRLFARVTNRRDVVLIDQRGTGRSAPLACDPPDPARPLAELVDMAAARERLQRCKAALQALPHGDLRQYTTTVAMADADAVRQALGATRVNVIGGSYGTRAVLEYMRQFPQTVRRAVIDGVAPPDMVLPATIAPDAQAAFDALNAACEAEPACAARYPALAGVWQRLLASLPREVAVTHPVTGQPDRVVLTRDIAVSMLRGPLYVPALASALPLAITDAAAGRFEALFALGGALDSGRKDQQMAEGMHFAVVCAEDGPRLQSAPLAPASAPASPPASPPASAPASAPAFGSVFTDLYRETCAQWPRGAVPEAFYAMPPAPAATLVLSGGIDPVTPPRHGQRTADALGTLARHVVVPQAGHGVMGIGCMRDVLYRFIDAATDTDALAVDTACVTAVPRPPAFQPVRAASAVGSTR